MKNGSQRPKVGSRKSVAGRLHIYTGEGKGKTTSSLGLALRAIGAGKTVAIVQFMKKPIFSEHKAIKKYNLPIDVFAFGIGFYKILGDKHTDEEHKKACQKALKKGREILLSKKYNLVIFDEINVAIDLGLADINEVISILRLADTGKSEVEIILTGRNAHPKLLKIADLVTEMKKRKHYFDKGTEARKGIEF